MSSGKCVNPPYPDDFYHEDPSARKRSPLETMIYKMIGVGESIGIPMWLGYQAGNWFGAVLQRHYQNVDPENWAIIGMCGAGGLVAIAYTSYYIYDSRKNKTAPTSDAKPAGGS